MLGAAPANTTHTRHAFAWRISALLLTYLGLSVQPSSGYADAFRPLPYSGPQLEPRVGRLLVARRHLRDPNFTRSVVLIVAHGAEGTLGIIINQPTPIALAEVAAYLEGTPASAQQLFFGGPVEMHRICFLARGEEPLPGTLSILDRVYFGAQTRILAELEGDAALAQNVRVYAGHAGWHAGQLALEIARGDWIVAAAEPELVFTQKLDRLWSILIDRYEPVGVHI